MQWEHTCKTAKLTTDKHMMDSLVPQRARHDVIQNQLKHSIHSEGKGSIFNPNFVNFVKIHRQEIQILHFPSSQETYLAHSRYSINDRW